MKKYGRWVLLCWIPMSGFADELGGDKVKVVLENVLNFIGGVWGGSICSLALISVGFACFVKGALPISRFFTVLIGSACIMGAPRLVQLITGGVS
jgi:hypothetical protein